jgi:hypothetical protein
LLEYLQPTTISGGSTFNSATATLTNYIDRQPFKVNELLIEVDFGQPTTQTGIRSLTASVVTGSPADIDNTMQRDSNGNVISPTSTAFTKKWSNMTATKNGDREMVRFRPSDTARAYSAAPQLTMQGIKVRRVIMRCEEL